MSQRHILHVLLVDDQRSVAGPIQAFIEQEGYRVSYASSGESAVEMFAAEMPDVVLMDVVMPGISGVEATRRLRALPVRHRPPIILMTGLASSDEEVIAGLEAGADEYLVKPIRFEVLAARIRAMHRLGVLQQTLAGVVANVIESIIVIDAKGLIRSFNRAAEACFGYSEAEVCGRNVSLLMCSPHREQHDRYIANYQRSGVPLVIGRSRRLEAMRKNGDVFPIRLGVTEVGTPEGPIYVGLVQDLAEEERLRRDIEHMAWHDALTGLPNRSRLYQRIGELISGNGHSQGLRFSLLFIDLDRFKPVNDRFGHLVGDEVIRVAGARLQGALARDDLVARVGGDEFVVVAVGPQAASAAPIGERLRTALSMPMSIGDLKLSISASIGIAAYPAHGCELQPLLQAADEAMYQAKAAGGDCLRVAGGAAND
jgi:diguanylate cyclase (GGDEF)-like protein/PAS domain S-box-containing protein